MRSLRFLWPVVLISACLVGLCAVTAVSLLHQQTTIAHVLRENVASRRAAVEAEECLSDLIALQADHVETVSCLHARLRVHLISLRQAADQPEERRLVEQVEAGFIEYMRRWGAMPPPGHAGHAAALRDATEVLEAGVLRPCQEFRHYNGRQIEETALHHEQVLRQLAWGMAGIGGMGGFAGLLLGFTVARAQSRSIRRLQVEVRAAAGKLGPVPAEIVLEGEFGGLHEQIDQLSGRIEKVVAELHQREHEVLRAEQLAAVGQLAAGVAHEVRNPLTSIKMLVQAALEEPDRPGLIADDLRVIEGEVRRMEGSLQTFLDFARPPKPSRRAVNLLEVVQHVLGLVRGRADRQRVRLLLDAPADPVVLTADAGQLQQVLVNLILNALDAMPTGGEVRVAVRRRSDGRVEVEVTDTGPGVSREILPRLFEPFVSSKDTGLGLGLVISRRLVEGHGGTIGAANRPGGGASFFVMLPTG